MPRPSNPPTSPKKKPVRKPPAKRAYNSPLRQQQIAETREKIIAAGSELVHGLTTWDWKNLTARAVGERAGVSERTVHRHFSTERKLRDAVLQRLVEESGVALDSLELGDYARSVGTMFRYLQSFSAASTAPPDSTFELIDRQRLEALMNAVARATPTWSQHKRETAAAILDIFWQPQICERLTTRWGFDIDHAVGTITWLIGLIEEAIREDRLPGDND